jgi:hypothetical protein
MGNIVEIEISEDNEGKLVAAPRVPRGDDVAWIFTGNLAGRILEVRRKGASPPTPSFAQKPASSNTASGQPFPVGGVATTPFEYQIFDVGTNTVLDWATNRNGGCVKFPDPPKQP